MVSGQGLANLAGVRHAASFEAKSEGLTQIEEAGTAAVQTDALADLHLKDTAGKIGDFANKIRGIEVELGEAKQAAEQVISTNTGMGEIAQEVANIKAKAAEQQSDLILAKDAVDKLIPTNASITVWCSLAPFSAPARSRRQHHAFL
ncbi:unnamed protein product [Durusdinium trenchii]|uniref:Uncharacterized protein n=1 Tax=Durusdinium trenchii TaxID=1381693 RepID=A0ABP0LTG0_9DINO